MATGTPRPFVPSSLRQSVFRALHTLSHPGIRASQRLLTSGLVLTQMYVSGLVNVFSARNQKYRDTQSLPLLNFLRLISDSAISTLIL